MVHGFQQIVTQAERRYNFVVHGLLPPGDEMAVSLLICRIQPMDSIGGNLSYISPSLLNVFPLMLPWALYGQGVERTLAWSQHNGHTPRQTRPEPRAPPGGQAARTWLPASGT